MVGVSDQCDWPAEAAERPVVTRSRVDCHGLAPAEVEARMQSFKQQAGAPAPPPRPAASCCAAPPPCRPTESSNGGGGGHRARRSKP